MGTGYTQGIGVFMDGENFGSERNNGVEMEAVFDFDFLFDYGDRIWLSDLMLLNIEEEV